MLDDRPYMRETGDRSAMPVTYQLMIANVAVFVLASVLEAYRIFPVTYYFALSLKGLAHGYVWQLLTFQFLHGGLMHLLLNMVAIYFFGRAIEHALGPRKMLRLYLASGSLGGLCQILLTLVAPSLFHAQGAGVVGASAGAFGLVAAFATLFPDQRITLLLFFVIPVSLRARTMLWISIGLAVFGILVPDGGIADGAHLGGILTGVFYVKWFVLGTGWRLPNIRFQRPPKLRVMPDPPLHSPPRPTNAPPIDDAFIAREIDPILEKISARGIGSLTDRERQILEAARNRMSRS